MLRFIQNGEMSREDAVELVKKYDGEFPSRNIKEVLEYLKIDNFDSKRLLINIEMKKFGSQV